MSSFWPWSSLLSEDLTNLHSDPIIMPKGFLLQRGYEILTVFVSVALLHTTILYLLKKYNPTVTDFEHWRESTQLLNMTTNLFLGILGIYYHVFLRSSTLSLEETVNEWKHFAIFGVGQAGYQAWSVILGIFMIKEPLTMIFHHISVICVALISVVFSNGFRYYTAFFYGVAEITSVPLAAMNVFKSKPSLVQSNPVLSKIVKFTFALSFLFVRVYLWMPIMMTFQGLSYNLSSTCPTMLCYVYLRTFMTCAAFLTLLQLFWAWKIIKGLMLVAGLIKKKEPKHVKIISPVKEE